MIFLAVFLCFFLLCVFSYCLPFLGAILGLFAPSVLTCARSGRRRVAITIDDVPDGDVGSLEKILAELRAYNVCATFFVIASEDARVLENTLVDAVRNTRHQLANHGTSNCKHALLSAKEIREQVESCATFIDRVYNLAGRQAPRQRFYRPGSGFFTPSMFSLNHRVTLGTIYPHDARISWVWLNVAFVKARLWLSGFDGDIVILHNRPWTPFVLRRIIPWLQEQNVEFVTLTKITKNSL